MLTVTKWIYISLLLIIILMRTDAKLPKSLGKKIQKQRKKLGLTQEELAEKIRISRAYAGYIEQGRNVPSVEILQKIARTLKIPLKELF